MARFDWIAFLRQHRIPYVTSGPNYSRKNSANIKCVFCGESDPSEHMGLAPFGAWGCLRNAAHRGKSPVRLVRQLLRCSEEEARRIVGGSAAQAPTADDFDASYAALKEAVGEPRPTKAGALSLLPEFKPLLNGSLFAQPFLNYLFDRGYREKQIEWLVKNYELHYVTKGLYAYRLIIPVRDRYGGLLTWTARTIRSEEQPRYRTLRVSGEEPLAKLAINQTILGLPLLWSASSPRILIVTEGPFDALKITAFGQSLGVYATCLFGLNAYREQVGELLALGERFDRLYLLLDPDAELEWLRLMEALAPLKITPLRLSNGAEDPGAMSGKDVVSLALDLLG